MNIISSGKYPANKLSNFAGHRFELDGVQINSMEGFLQSLKFKSPEMQAEVCKYVGFGAKKKGSQKNWQRKQVLYWRGKEIDRHCDAYQKLLDRAYGNMFKHSESFRKALFASHNAVLKHSIGKNNTHDTILTVSEFCGRLTKLRAKLDNKLF